jgi:hypothetical protein
MLSAARSSTMFQLFGVEPSDGATVTVVVPGALIVAPLRFVA